MKPTFRINEAIHVIEPHQREISLLNYLRDSLKLTGTKCGCDDGSCGGCRVIKDGEAVRSCILKLKQLEGKQITTIEGLSRGEQLHPLQSAFVECSAIQCGFCTPGLIMAAKALLDRNPSPSEKTILTALSKNLCRCGTYPRVIKAVQRAAATLRGEPLSGFILEAEGEENEIIGKSVLRLDSIGKATGETKFTADLCFDKMLHGKIVWSKYPHAEITSIDTKQAGQTPGVKLVLTSKDIPGTNRFGVVHRDDQPVLAEGKVRYIGEPVAVVFAEDLEAAKEAAKSIRVDYKKLQGVFSTDDALAKGAPLIHEEGNIIEEVSFKRGKLNAAFQQADVIVEASFSTPPIEHAFIETEGALAVPAEEGKVTVYAGNQSPFEDREQLASILALNPENVRVCHVPVGGAFGGKSELSVHAFVALAALMIGRPARIVLTRTESLRFHPKKHGFDMKYRIAAQADGKLLGMDVELITDGGAYASWSPVVIVQAAAFGTGPYFVPNLRVKGKAVYTNNLVGGAMRGFGVNQVHFAVESAMDILARKLNIDPITLRKRNAIDIGLPIVSGQILTDGVGYKQTLEAVEARLKEELVPLKQTGKNIGIGIASSWKNVGYGLQIKERTGAKIELLEDGKFLLKTACIEMGQGSLTALCQMASDILGAGFDDFQVIAGDTELVPEGGGVMASRGVYLWGHATIKASRKMRELLLEESARLLGKKSQDLDLMEGYIIEKEDKRRLLGLKDLAVKSSRPLSVEEYFTLPKTYPLSEDADDNVTFDPKDQKHYHTIVYNTTAVAVKVDESTGNIEVLNIVFAMDSGRIINPEAARSSAEGAIIQGMGYALSENFVIEQGMNKTNSLRKCHIPRITMTPPKITTIFVDSPDPTGPFGSKGVAESAGLGTAPAITNAIYDAICLRIKTLPVREYFRKSGKFFQTPAH